MNKQSRAWQAPFGLVVDLYDIAMFRFSSLRSLNKFRQLRHEARRAGARTLIETGTYLGVTTKRCAPHFERVLTVEIDPLLALQAREYLKPHSNVEVIEGDASVELPNLLRRPEMTDVFVFLDAHFSGGVTAHGDVPEPALVELEALAASPKVVGFIIDDFRSFGTEPGFPSKSQLLADLESKFPSFNLRVNLDQVVVVRR